jgi:hypothetical protein
MSLMDVRRRTATTFGIEPWISLQDTEDQLRLIRPIVLHTNFGSSMLAFYELLAESHGYSLSAHGTPLRGVVSAVFVREDV